MSKFNTPLLLLALIISVIVVIVSWAFYPAWAGLGLLGLFVLSSIVFYFVVGFVANFIKAFRKDPPAITNSTINIQNIIAGEFNISNEESFRTDKRIVERTRDIRADVENRPADELYRPPILPDRIAYVYAVRHHIADNVRNIVLNWGGGWAGCSAANFDIYFGLAQTHKLIPNKLAIEINDFYFLTQPFLNSGNINQDEQFLETQYLAFDIDRQLNSVLHTHSSH
jgi:hypothetical protein